ncbi:MAG: PhoH family protein [Gammaproteobacteria bacterium]|nr:PhoH family protein [Gammaproteobacteria bacterium]
METTHFSQTLVLSPEDNKRLLNLCGRCDEHLHLIEKSLDVSIKQRGFTFHISGTTTAVSHAITALTELYDAALKTPFLALKHIHLHLQGTKNTQASPHSITHRGQPMEIRTKRAVITARGENQIRYLKNVAEHDVNFGIGPAGTGKTYLAVACAVHALETARVSRIVLVRPIVEAGEKLGFLPGDLAQKVHPYLQPLYDALYEMMGFDQVAELIERGVIELLPLAYMRGRSLNDSFIILDEGQNTTIEQMKMFLTRIGFNSRAIITGDITQIDLSNHRDSGLIHAIELLEKVKGISFSEFKASDVVRHPLVQSIVEAYELYNQLNKKNK